jgi:hypothetical protein
MENAGLRIIGSKDNLLFFIIAILIFFPLFGGIYYIVNQERLFPSLVFIAIGDVVTIVLFICHLINKKSYFFQIAIGFVSLGISFGFGGWLVFTTILSSALKNMISTPITYSFSALVFLSYSIVLFMRYHIDFKKNEHKYLKGLDFSTGIIDPLKTKLFNPKLDQNEIAKSPFVFPIKIFLFIAIPLGGVGCVAIMGHLGNSVQFIIFALAMYTLSTISIIGGMAGYYSLFTLARLQIKHKKWFLLITGDNAEKPA